FHRVPSSMRVRASFFESAPDPQVAPPSRSKVAPISRSVSSVYDWIAGTSRQVCWSHLRRDFQAMIDRGGPAEPIGRKLLRLSDRLFRWWHRLEAKKVDRGRFGAAMVRLRREVQAALEDGTRCPCPTTRGSCAEILRVEESLWTFARVAGVAPTNNAA